ncbi:MAG: hypothetical protein QOH49_1802 [Acidobacteriota bacterium]|jgi:hypothetical protein|nr:hypothetical protein [Acidobacteriota bacterium]
MKQSILLGVGLVLLMAATGSANAQSTDRDHPTPLSSNELTGRLDGNGGETFYSFVAGPGELTITVDVKSTDGTFAMPFELLNANGADSLLCCEFAQAGAPGETGRSVKSIRIKSRQTVILHLTEYKYGAGTYRVRFDGPTSFGGGAAPRGVFPSSRRPGTSAGGNRMNLPVSGTLLIRMRDGSTKEIDLSLVREASVQP